MVFLGFFPPIFHLGNILYEDLLYRLKGQVCKRSASLARGFQLKQDFSYICITQGIRLNVIYFFLTCTFALQAPLAEVRAYQQMALVASAFAFAWSKWNLEAGQEQVVFKVCGFRLNLRKPAYSSITVKGTETINLYKLCSSQTLSSTPAYAAAFSVCQ